MRLPQVLPHACLSFWAHLKALFKQQPSAMETFRRHLVGHGPFGGTGRCAVGHSENAAL